MMTLKNSTKAVVILCLLATLSACGGKKRKGGVDAKLTQQRVEELYNTGKKSLDRGNYQFAICLLYTSPSPRDKRQSRMPSSA